MKNSWIQTALTLLLLLGVTTALYLYTAGYRINKEPDEGIDFSKRGMVGAKSIPEGAKVYLNDELVTATNDSIQGVNPGFHKLRIEKNGFVTWEKEIEVFAELVTDITAILVSQSPRLEPLTNTGAMNPSISPTDTKIAYFTKNGEEPGIWIIPLTGEGLSLFRSNPFSAIKDIPGLTYSDGKSIKWGPAEKQILVETENEEYYLIDLQSQTTEATASPELVEQTWAEENKQKRIDFIAKLEIPEELTEIAVAEDTLWSPDNKKFFYKTTEGEQIIHKVYNLEKPLPVGEKMDTTVFTTSIYDPQPLVTWYADSYHLLLTEEYNEETSTGKISIIRLDGTNKTEVYNSTLFSDKIFSVPSGDRIVILTSLKSNDQTDLYTVSIR